MTTWEKIGTCLKAWSLCILLLTIVSGSTTPSSNTKKTRRGSLSEHQHKRLARSPQIFGNSFDPITIDEVKDHFGLPVPAAGPRSRENPRRQQGRSSLSARQSSNSRSLFSEISIQGRKKSTPVRFP